MSEELVSIAVKPGHVIVHGGSQYFPGRILRMPLSRVPPSHLDLAPKLAKPAKAAPAPPRDTDAAR